MNHSHVADGKMEVRCLQFLHNLEDTGKIFRGAYRPYARIRHETYGKGQKAKLAADLSKLFFPAPRSDVAEKFLTGTYVVGQMGFRSLKKALTKQENAAMLDHQIEVN